MRILCLGDSLVQGFGVPEPRTWCALASAMTGHDFVNCGSNGATTGELLDRFPPREGEFGACLILAGLADIFMGMPLSVPFDRMRRLCLRAAELGMTPSVCIPMPLTCPDDTEAWCDGPVDMARVRNAYGDYADGLIWQCEGDGIRTIDLRFLSDPVLFLDGIHPNAEGHRALAVRIAEAFGQAAPPFETPGTAFTGQG